MKSFIKLLVPILFLISCEFKSEDQKQTQNLNPDEIRINEIVHEKLTSTQVAQIKKIHSTFKEVDNISLEQTIEDFKRDLHPDNEIKVWLTMAAAYQNYLDSKNNQVDLNTKTEVYRLILSRSMMPDDEAIQHSDLKILSQKEAQNVLSFYKVEPDPIDVMKK